MIMVAIVATVAGEWAAGFGGAGGAVLLGMFADTIAGGTFLLTGIVAVERSRRFGLLAFLAGLAWFAGNFGGWLVWVHRPLMLHAALAYPDGRLAHRWIRGLLVVWWVAALVPGLAVNAAFSMLLASATVVLCWVTSPAAGAGAAARTAHRNCGCHGARVRGRVGRRRRGDSRARTAIGHACAAVRRARHTRRGDPGVRVLHPAGEADAVIEVTEDDPSVSVDALRLEASAATADPATRRLLTAAVARFDENRVLHEALENRVAEVRASRRRLVEAGVAERQRLERRLADGAFGYLDELGDVLSILRKDPVLMALATTCLAEIEHTRVDLAQLARGLLPAVLTERGLHNALSDLAAHATVPTVVRAPNFRLPPLVEADRLVRLRRGDGERG